MEQTNQNQNTQAQQPPKFVCTGDCRKCRSMQQWSYCASIHAYSNMRVLDRVMETLASVLDRTEALERAAADIAARIEAMQSGEAAVFDPGGPEAEPFPREFAKDAEAPA